MNCNNAIIVKNLGVRYQNQVEALKNITLEVLPSKVTGMIGPNGAGKSTLMKGMLGLIDLHTGQVQYKNKPLKEQREKIAYVPQRSQIDWTYPVTVWDVVMMGRVKQTGWFTPFSVSSRQKAKLALEKVDMYPYRYRPIGKLSGGQQQRVFLARSLSQEADIFFFDEPFVGVDQKTEEILFNIFKELAAKGKIVLVVNHDLGESINNFDDLILLNKELISYGKRQLVLEEHNLNFAYEGKVTFFPQLNYQIAA
jgi:manganese/iron transport system ATP-binding protein